MKAPELTPEERAHATKGGRVFIIEEIPGPLWRVLSISSQDCKVILKPDETDGYTSRMYAQNLALNFATLSEDSPMVRRCPYGYTTTPRETERGVSWDLRFLKDGDDIGGEVFLIADDTEAAYWAAQAEAIKAGEKWLSSRW